MIQPYTPPTIGPIALVGEAPGFNEEKTGQPFVGGAGRVLGAMCYSAGIDVGNLREQDITVKGLTYSEYLRTGGNCFITNVFNVRPEANNVELFFGGKEFKENNPFEPISFGAKKGWLRPEFYEQLSRLKEELETISPNVVVAFGNTALWALCQVTGIGAYRGTVLPSVLVPGLKVVPIWHPAAVMRKWDLYVHSVCDLVKARWESKFPDIRMKPRKIYISPTIADLDWFWEEHLSKADLISIDIENPKGPLSCIGFAPSAELALVLPFVDKRNYGHHYWQKPEEEKYAWRWMKKVLSSEIPKLGQNFLTYDAIVLFRRYRLWPRAVREDTMLQHHAYQPEMDKGLGFLTSIYCNEPAYKKIRPRGFKTDKREE